MWIDKLIKTRVPSNICRALVLWIWVAWVIELHRQFEKATAVVIKQGTQAMNTLDLPLPNLVSSECYPTGLGSSLTDLSGELDLKRYQAIEAVIDTLQILFDKFRRHDYNRPQGNQYSFVCGSVMLGALTRELDWWEMLSPRPEFSFQNMSFSDVSTKVKAVTPFNWCPYNGGYNSYQHPCRLSTMVIDAVDKIALGLKGLSINDIRGCE